MQKPPVTHAINQAKHTGNKSESRHQQTEPDGFHVLTVPEQLRVRGTVAHKPVAVAARASLNEVPEPSDRIGEYRPLGARHSEGSH